MARLPSAADLGEPNFGSGRPVARYDNSGLVEGAADLARGVENLATGVRKMQDARERDEFAQGKARYLVAKAQLDQKYAEDNDWQGLTDRYKDDLRKVAESARDGIKSDRARQAFMDDIGVHAAQSIAKMDERRNALEGDAYVAGINSDAAGLREAYLQAKDDTDRAEILKTYRDRLGAAVERGFVSRVDAEKVGREWAQGTAEASIKLLPPQERIAVLRGSGSLVDRITQAESAGRADAQNPDSSARGLGQFINSTWLRTVKRYAPELAKGRDDKAILALRDNPKISRAMTEALARGNAQGLQSAGIEANDGNVYLAHFAGIGGATKLLKADPSTPVEKLLDADAIKANAFLKGKTAGEVIAWAHGKVGSRESGLIAELPTDKRAELLAEAEKEYQELQDESEKQARAAAATRKDELELAILQGNITDEKSILDDPLIDDGQRATLIRSFREQDSKLEARRNVEAALREGRYIDPEDSANKKGLGDLWDAGDRTQKLMEGDATTLGELHFIYEKTGGMVPGPAKHALNAMLASRNPSQIVSSLSVMDSLYQRNPQAFKREFGDETLNQVLRYREESTTRTPTDIAKEYSEARDPMVRKARQEREKEATAITDKWTIETVRNDLDVSALPFTEPSAPLSPIQQSIALADYKGFFTRAYAGGADESTARSVALQQMALTWGASPSNAGRLMRNPPEHYYGTFDGSHEWMRKHLEDELVKAGFLEDANPAAPGLPRSLKPYYVLADERTLAEISAGRKPSYSVWVQKNGGQFEMLPQRFDWKAEEARVAEERRAAFQRERKEREPIRQMQELRPPLVDPYQQLQIELQGAQ